MVEKVAQSDCATCMTTTLYDLRVSFIASFIVVNLRAAPAANHDPRPRMLAWSGGRGEMRIQKHIEFKSEEDAESCLISAKI